MIFRRFLVWLSNTDFYAFILLNIVPFIRFSTQLTKTRGNQYHEAYAILKRGDFIVTKDKNKLTAILIGGDWSHAVQFMGKRSEGRDYECCEMTHHHYTRSDFFDIVKESSVFAIYRCVDYDDQYAEQIVKFIEEHFTTAKYDQGFELGVRSLYCSELIYQADYERRLQVSLEDLRSLGRKYISPTGLTKGLNVVQVFHSDNVKPRY